MIFGKEKSYWTTRFAFIPTKVTIRDTAMCSKKIWMKSYDVHVTIDALGNKYFSRYLK